MLGEQRAGELVKRILALSKADQTEVIVEGRDSALTRFANNTIHQNVAEVNLEVTVRAIVGKRVGMASSNDLSPAALERVVEQALAHARQQPEDPDFPGVPEPHPIEPVSAYDQVTAGYSPGARAAAVKIVCDLAAERGFSASGAFRTTAAELAVGNSYGLFAYHPGTHADLQTVMTGEDGTGRAQASAVSAASIDAEAVGREAVAKTTLAQNPRAVEPGDYTVICDPYVTADILQWLNFSGMSAEAVQEGRSWMSDRIGTRLLSPLVSIWDDGRDPESAPLPFDYEGMPRCRVQIVDQGQVCGPVYNRYTAAKEGRESTGHAMHPGRDRWEIVAMHLTMAPGAASMEELIRSTSRGLYITRFWYTRLVHPRDCVLTGMTRDGVVMIENGELTHAVKNLRFTQSYVQALADIDLIGAEQRTLIDERGLCVRVPALKIGHFNFTGLTV